MVDIEDLPELMQPLLDYLDNFLSQYPYGSYIFNIISTIFSCACTVSAVLLSLLLSLFSSGDTPWSERLNVEKILPPLITLFAIYFALITFYRTTGYFVRTLFGIFKWSFILTALGVLAGYFVVNAGVDGEAGGAGGLVGLGLGLIPAIILNRQPIGTQPRTNLHSSQTHSSKTKLRHEQKARPKVYESWDKHREWQYSENAD